MHLVDPSREARRRGPWFAGGGYLRDSPVPEALRVKLTVVDYIQVVVSATLKHSGNASRSRAAFARRSVQWRKESGERPWWAAPLL